MMDILFEAHKEMTRKRVFTFTIEECVRSLYDINDIKDINKEELSKKAFSEFCNKNEGRMIGSVHQNPLFWTEVFITDFCKFLNDDTIEKLQIANGCCTKVDCPLNIFYLILYSLISCKE